MSDKQIALTVTISIVGILLILVGYVIERIADAIGEATDRQPIFLSATGNLISGIGWVAVGVVALVVLSTTIYKTVLEHIA